GAGIGGLMLTAALAHFDRDTQNLDVRVYEAAPALAEIGAGINLWLRSWEIIKKLNLEGLFVKMMQEAPTEKSRLVFQLRKSDQDQGVHMSDLWMKGGTMRFHRAELQMSLMSLVGSQVQLNRRLSSYTEYQNHVELLFADGSLVNCDVLVAADGIRSATRKQYLSSVRRELKAKEEMKRPEQEGEDTDPVWSGTLAYRGLLAHEKIEREFPGHRGMTRPVIHLVVYPLSNGRFTNVVAFTTDPKSEGMAWPKDKPATGSATQEELREEYKGWEPEVQALINCIESPSKWAINNLNPIESFASHRVFLAGDSAHAMTPHQGAGAGQAIEDAYILASLLTQPGVTRDSIPAIAEVYSNVRCPAANAVLLASRDQGKWCELDHPHPLLQGTKEGEVVGNAVLDDVFADISEAWEWVWRGSAETDRERAVEMLRNVDAGGVGAAVGGGWGLGAGTALLGRARAASYGSADASMAANKVKARMDLDAGMGTRGAGDKSERVVMGAMGEMAAMVSEGEGAREGCVVM
ncbi:salicylate hydroxylase, partial [Coprinopsis marcescibilis]